LICVSCKLRFKENESVDVYKIFSCDKEISLCMPMSQTTEELTEALRAVERPENFGNQQKGNTAGQLRSWLLMDGEGISGCGNRKS
jgi:hypothetical protein